MFHQHRTTDRPQQIYTGDRTLDFVPASERWAGKAGIEPGVS